MRLWRNRIWRKTVWRKRVGELEVGERELEVGERERKRVETSMAEGEWCAKGNNGTHRTLDSVGDLGPGEKCHISAAGRHACLANATGGLSVATSVDIAGSHFKIAAENSLRSAGTTRTSSNRVRRSLNA